MPSRQKKKSDNEEPPYAKASGDEEPVVEEDGQTALFGETQSSQEGPLVNGKPPKAKAPTKEVKQANLFEEKKEVKKKDEDDKGYTAGETVELDL